MSTRHQNVFRTYFVALPACVLMLASGCCHYCQHQQAAACAPVASSAPVVRYGAVCEVPSDRVVVSKGSSISSSINDAPRPKVVVSEPGGRSGGGWKRSDPESLATTRVEGAVDSDSRTR